MMTFAAGLRVGGAHVCSLVLPLPPPVNFSNHAICMIFPDSRIPEFPTPRHVVAPGVQANMLYIFLSNDEHRNNAKLELYTIQYSILSGSLTKPNNSEDCTVPKCDAYSEDSSRPGHFHIRPHDYDMSRALPLPRLQDPGNVHHTSNTSSTRTTKDLFLLPQGKIPQGRAWIDDYCEDMPVQKGQQTQTVATAALPVWWGGSGPANRPPIEQNSRRSDHVLMPPALYYFVSYLD
jgi:hypothetical protein